jgi:hypothetical protein
MTQDTLTLSFSDVELQGLDAALTDIETRLVGLVGLDNDGRRRLTKMGGKSEKFCRQAMAVLGENPSLVAPGLKFPAAQSNLTTLDQLRSRLVRVRSLAERMADTEMVLGSTIMWTSLKGYAQLKLLGKNQGLDGHREVLRARFSRVTAAPEEEVPEAA